MARVYTSRQLIDPNLASYMEQVIQNRVANQMNRDKMVGESVRHMLTGIGSAVDDAYTNWKNKKEEQARYDQIMGQSTIAQQSDPNYIAAVKDYAKTGNSQPITSYMLDKEAAEARKLEAQKREDAANAEKTRNAAIRLENDRTDYLKAQKSMMDSMAAGDYTTAEIYKSQMNAIEKRYEPGTFGSSSDELYNARKRALEEAAAKRAQEKADQEAMELGEKNLKAIQEVNENDRLHKVALFKNSLPTTFAKETDKKAVYDLIEQNEDLTIPEKTALHEEIRKIESGSTQKKKSIQSATAGKAGEATGKAIDEANNKAEAKKYVGKKVNSLEWNKIPAEQKKYLNRDAQGVVTEK